MINIPTFGATALAAVILSGVSAAAVDMNFTHDVDVYSHANPVGPDAYVNADAYLRTYELKGAQTRRSEWLQMNRTNYYVHDGNFNLTRWQWALPPNTTYFTTGTSARLYKGTLKDPNMTQWGNPGGDGGLYSGMDRTSFLLWEQSPIADLHTIVFQAYLTTGSPPGFNLTPYQDVNGDFYVNLDPDELADGRPTLTVFLADGSTHTFSADDGTAELYESRATPFDHPPVAGIEGPVEMYIYENYRSYRWDLNNLGLVGSDIVRFGIEFTVEAHVSLRSISLDQAGGGIIPEPRYAALLFGFVITGFMLLRRRCPHKRA